MIRKFELYQSRIGDNGRNERIKLLKIFLFIYILYFIFNMGLASYADKNGNDIQIIPASAKGVEGRLNIVGQFPMSSLNEYINIKISYSVTKNSFRLLDGLHKRWADYKFDRIENIKIVDSKGKVIFSESNINGEKWHGIKILSNDCRKLKAYADFVWKTSSGKKSGGFPSEFIYRGQSNSLEIEISDEKNQASDEKNQEDGSSDSSNLAEETFLSAEIGHSKRWEMLREKKQLPEDSFSLDEKAVINAVSSKDIDRIEWISGQEKGQLVKRKDEFYGEMDLRKLYDGSKYIEIEVRGFKENILAKRISIRLTLDDSLYFFKYHRKK